MNNLTFAHQQLRVRLIPHRCLATPVFAQVASSAARIRPEDKLQFAMCTACWTSAARRYQLRPRQWPEIVELELDTSSGPLQACPSNSVYFSATPLLHPEQSSTRRNTRAGLGLRCKVSAGASCHSSSSPSPGHTVSIFQHSPSELSTPLVSTPFAHNRGRLIQDAPHAAGPAGQPSCPPSQSGKLPEQRLCKGRRAAGHAQVRLRTGV